MGKEVPDDDSKQTFVAGLPASALTETEILERFDDLTDGLGEDRFHNPQAVIEYINSLVDAG